jgi:hypothetical protein
MDHQYFRIIFPERLSQAAVDSFLLNLGALPRQTELIFEEWSDSTGIHHRIGLPQMAVAVLDQLRSTARGVRITPEAPLPIAPYVRVVELGLTNKRAPLRTEDTTSTATSILTSLQPTSTNEALVIQWILRPAKGVRRFRSHMPTTIFKLPFQGNDLTSKLLVGAFNTTMSMGAAALNRFRSRDEQLRALEQTKYTGPLFQGICRIGVYASNESRARALSNRALNAFRVSATQYVTFEEKISGPMSGAVERMKRGTASVHERSILINAKELSGLGWFPLESPLIPGLQLGGSRQIPPSADIPIQGRVLAKSDYPGMRQRPLALDFRDALRHMHTMGSTGSGKTVFLLNCIVQDINHGAGVTVIDPKGDLIDDILDRIPPGREQDVILLDPTDKEAVVGLNLLADGRSNPDLATDNVVGMFKDLNRDSWGPRLERTLRAAVRSLVTVPGMTMLEVAELLTKDQFREQVLEGLVLTPALLDFWVRFEEMTPKERNQIVEPIMNKLESFIFREDIRHIIGQSQGSLDMNDVLANRKILLVPLPKGHLGKDTAALLGSMVMLSLWEAVQKRLKVSPNPLPYFCYVDECQDFLHLPTPLEDVLAQARGYGFGLTLAHQHLDQLDTSMQAAVLANTNSRVLFRLPAKDAGVMAREYGDQIDETDFMNLGRYEVIASIATSTQMRPGPVTGVTNPKPPAFGSAPAARAYNRAHNAILRSVVEADIVARHESFASRPIIGTRPVQD